MNERSQSPPLTADARDPEPGQARETSSVVFCGDPAKVRTGFALALKLMGIDAPSPDESGRDPKQGE